MMEIVPATSQLLRDYYRGVAVPTTYALVALEDGAPWAVAGLVRAPGGVRILYSDSVRQSHSKHPRTVVKLARQVLALAQARGWTVSAIAEKDETGDATKAARFLEYLGFHKQEDGSYLKWPVYSMPCP